MGITPAHAGKRVKYISQRTYKKDHPRTRGEKLFSYVLIEIEGGSPPHTRGKAYSIHVKK